MATKPMTLGDLLNEETSSTQKPSTKSTSTKKAPAKKTASTKAPAKKTASTKAPAKKTASTKASAKKTASTKAPAKKAPAKKAPAKKAPAKKAPAKKTTTTKSTDSSPDLGFPPQVTVIINGFNCTPTFTNVTIDEPLFKKFTKALGIFLKYYGYPDLSIKVEIKQSGSVGVKSIQTQTQTVYTFQLPDINEIDTLGLAVSDALAEQLSRYYIEEGIDGVGLFNEILSFM